MNESIAPLTPLAPTEPAGGRRLLASPWHTAILVGILLAIAAYGASVQHQAHTEPGVMERHGSAVPLYLGIILAQWGLFRYATVGLRKRGLGLRDLLGERWAGPRDVVRDMVIALLVWAVWSLGEWFVLSHLGKDPAADIGGLLPRVPIEIALWVALSLTAGFCEEVVFRGYLQKQFTALTGSAVLGLVIQAVIFGVSHGYQGLRNMILITIYGAVFGALALWRKSLKPGIVLHAWTDIFSGIFGPR
ncbi:MAG TPA: type II CAAX endopeptidase family protein [Candidatus Polarisedimenticolia bacterium]|nr:type II CAAX endopeptidase family protein [Candidatus Polarisedimenticolia bacterium]